MSSGQAGPGPIVPGILSLALFIGACSPADTSPSTAPTLGPAISSSASPTPGPTASGEIGTRVVIDSDLLAILPDAVDGLALTESTDAEAASLDDPLLGRVASALAAGLAIEPTSGDFVFAVVIRLAPGEMDANVFRDWRDSYDEGACSQADGVSGHAETEVDGRTIYIGTCQGGVRTYHVWLEDRDILVSASAVGERRLGEKLVENLRP